MLFSPNLRAVTLDLDETSHRLYPVFFYDGEISEKLEDLIGVVIADTNVPSKDFYTAEDETVRLDYPKEIPIEGELV